MSVVLLLHFVVCIMLILHQFFNLYN